MPTVCPTQQTGASSQQCAKGEQSSVHKTAHTQILAAPTARAPTTPQADNNMLCLAPQVAQHPAGCASQHHTDLGQHRGKVRPAFGRAAGPGDRRFVPAHAAGPGVCCAKAAHRSGDLGHLLTSAAQTPQSACILHDCKRCDPEVVVHCLTCLCAYLMHCTAVHGRHASQHCMYHLFCQLRSPHARLQSLSCECNLCRNKNRRRRTL
jgi:hypothetical protein